MVSDKSYKFLLSSGKCFCFVLLFCVLSLDIFAQQPSLTPITLQLKWTHAFQFAGYYAALENGYYRDVGLEVEILAGGPTMDVVTQVVSGQADFGVGTSGLLLDYAAGKPIKVLGVVYQHSPMVLIMRAEKPTETVQDLRGETVMIETHAADLLAMFKRLGLSLGSMNCIDHTGHAEDMIKYDAHAITAYLTNEPFVLDQLGVKYFVIVHGLASRDDYEKQVLFNETLFLDLRAMKEDVPKNDLESARHPVGVGARHISP